MFRSISKKQSESIKVSSRKKEKQTAGQEMNGFALPSFEKKKKLFDENESTIECLTKILGNLSKDN